jgi:hypothetical protein
MIIGFNRKLDKTEKRSTVNLPAARPRTLQLRVGSVLEFFCDSVMLNSTRFSTKEEVHPASVGNRSINKKGEI